VGRLHSRFFPSFLNYLSNPCLTLTSGEGFFDPYALMWGFRRKAESMGVRFVSDEVVGFDVDDAGCSVTHVHLAGGGGGGGGGNNGIDGGDGSGGISGGDGGGGGGGGLPVSHVVNAAGARASLVDAMLRRAAAAAAAAAAKARSWTHSSTSKSASKTYTQARADSVDKDSDDTALPVSVRRRCVFVFDAKDHGLVRSATSCFFRRFFVCCLLLSMNAVQRHVTPFRVAPCSKAQLRHVTPYVCL
jgi:hypothetical protein